MKKNDKSERKCFRCGDPNHLIGECPKPPRDKNQIAFVGGSWSDSGEEDDEKIQDETCLVAQAPNEVCSESSYFSDENSSIDDLALDNEYDKLCKMSLKIITKNKRYALELLGADELSRIVDCSKQHEGPTESLFSTCKAIQWRINFFLGLQIKQMEDGIFFNQSKYIKEMLKKFGLEDSKPMKTPMSSDTKLTKDEECESVDSTKYRGMIGTTHLGLWYPKGTDIETVVYADSDHARDYVDRKSTSGICTFVGCCLTSWFSKKQTALAISTTEAEYVSARKACQQALWMKQALIDYDVRLDDVPIMCDNKGAIDLSKNPVQHSRTKHIEIRHHFLRDNVQKGHISIEKVSSVDNIADILTKPLKRESFNYLRLGLGMMEHIP
ncbi:retrovirus-related pol polyprotein from transposon TNT 1-94 [Tanacetum coccineum]